jgi:hypothetical protein
MKNLSRHTDLLCELEISLLMRGIQTGEVSKLGWLIRVVKHAIGAASLCLSSQFFPRFIALVLMHLVLLVMFVAQISTTISIPVPPMCVLYHKLTVDFLGISRRICLVSSD